jgi:putative colanic acid biosynthesis acetyltransferase WcaF
MQLNQYNNSSYVVGASVLQQMLWYFLGFPLVETRLLPFSSIKVFILKLFGADVGKSITIKTGVKVKYPWNLKIGDNVWIGENTWIDNLVLVKVGSNVCISQGVYLCTGNHDWSKPGFNLITGEIHIEDGAWLAAKSIVSPGATIGQGAVLSLGSVTTKSLQPMRIYVGNPAQITKERKIQPPAQP